MSAPRDKKKRMTIREFAKLANTSTATVSRAFSNKPGVSAKERDRILALATSTGYRPNKIAQNLALQKSHIIGFVAGDLENPLYVHFFRRVQNMLHENGYHALITDSEKRIEKERKNIELLLHHQAEGFIVFPVHDWDNRTSIDHLLELKLKNYPLVVVGRINEFDFDCVTSEEFETASQLTRELISRGHRRIGFVGAEEYNRPALERIAGVEKALAETGLSLAPQHRVELRDGWEEAMIAMLHRADRPTALVMANDVLAFLACKPLSEAGFSIPEDLSTVAFGNSLWMRHNTPTLTGSEANFDLIAERGLSVLLDRLENNSSETEHHLIPQAIHIRESIGSPTVS